MGAAMESHRVRRLAVSIWNTLFVAGMLACADGLASAQTPAPEAPPPDAQVAGIKPTESERPPASPRFVALFTDTATDFTRLASIETAAILAVGGTVAAVGHLADHAVSRTLSGSDGLAPWFGSGHFVGGPYFQLGGAFATYTIGRAIGSPRTTIVGADLVRANLVALGLTQAIKVSARRSRPDGARFSFPSGHTSATFATAAVLQRHLGWKAGVPAYAVATYVGVARIQRQRHYLSDVAFGAALGVVAGRTATINVGRHRLTVSPLAVPGGGGIMVRLDPDTANDE